MEWLWVLLTFVVAIITSILSGIAGGGGGFITIPYYLFLGMPPANALATAKLGGIGVTVSAMTAFKGKGLVHKRWLYVFMGITLVCSLISAWLIPKIDPSVFENVIGVLLLVLIPTLFINKGAFKPGERSQKFIAWGFVAYAIFSFMQTLVGTGMGTILVLVLMFLFGLTALEANATKRVAQSVQSFLLFFLLALQGLVVWTHGIAGLAGSLIGGHIGSKIALKKGAEFVKYVLAVVMAVSGIILLLT